MLSALVSHAELGAGVHKSCLQVVREVSFFPACWDPVTEPSHCYSVEHFWLLTFLIHKIVRRAGLLRMEKTNSFSAMTKTYSCIWHSYIQTSLQNKVLLLSFCKHRYYSRKQKVIKSVFSCNLDTRALVLGWAPGNAVSVLPGRQTTYPREEIFTNFFL